MTRALKRLQESGQSHCITFSCYQRQQKLVDSRLCALFVERLEAMRGRFDLRVYGYVVMPEHVHLLVGEPERGMLCEAVHYLKLSFAKLSRRLREDDEAGAFWQKRYYDRNIRCYRDFCEKLRYIHRNPVKRGLCAQPEQWRWSSFRHYASREFGVVEIESEWTARLREKSTTVGETSSNPG